MRSTAAGSSGLPAKDKQNNAKQTSPSHQPLTNGESRQTTLSPLQIADIETFQTMGQLMGDSITKLLSSVGGMQGAIIPV
ncbi:hypothetical protein NDU88_004698 [Pleurodeles waltl]|uniref:Uncharacterized protein n=1 Tax=Pleurodeles waltl TaxID=8319 RepID=A0AAV7UGG9_PLEWA|nr:hypothetical protein NDU88_004698 [Pleurodeles waltl]